MTTWEPPSSVRSAAGANGGRLLDRDDNVTVTILEPIEASADDLAPALAAV